MCFVKSVGVLGPPGSVFNGLGVVLQWSYSGLAGVLFVLSLAYNGLNLQIYLTRGLGSNCILVLLCT